MIIVSSAPFATATSATTANSPGGTAPAARTTSSSGPVDSASSAGGTTAGATKPRSTYMPPAVARAPNRARGYTRETSRTSSARFADVSKPTNE